MNIARALKRARKSKDISQAELARRLDVAPSTVASWETKVHGPRIDRLPVIARVLGVEVSELVA